MDKIIYETIIDDERLSIRESDVHGFGLFANEYIPKGDDIGYWLTTDPEDCGLKLDNGYKEYCKIGRFCNHSENPNTNCNLVENPDMPERWLLKSEGINANEEIFVDYHWAYDITGFKSDLIE